MNLEYYSSLALVTSVVVYVLAMFAHAAEWAAAGRMGLRAEPAKECCRRSAPRCALSRLLCALSLSKGLRRLRPHR